MDYKKKYLKYKSKYLELKGGQIKLIFKKKNKKCDKIDLKTINEQPYIYFFPDDEKLILQSEIEIPGEVKLSIRSPLEDISLLKCYGNLNKDIFKYKIYSLNENFQENTDFSPDLQMQYIGPDEENEYKFVFDAISTKESLEYILEKKNVVIEIDAKKFITKYCNIKIDVDLYDYFPNNIIIYTSDIEIRLKFLIYFFYLYKNKKEDELIRKFYVAYVQFLFFFKKDPGVNEIYYQSKTKWVYKDINNEPVERLSVIGGNNITENEELKEKLIDDIKTQDENNKININFWKNLFELILNCHVVSKQLDGSEYLNFFYNIFPESSKANKNMIFDIKSNSLKSDEYTLCADNYDHTVRLFNISKKCIKYGIFLNYKYDNTNQERTIVALNTNNRLFDNIYKTTYSFCVEGTQYKIPQISFDTELMVNIPSHKTDFEKKMSEEGIIEILEDENKIKRCNDQQISHQQELFTVGNKNFFNVYMPMYNSITPENEAKRRKLMIIRDKIKAEIGEAEAELREANTTLEKVKLVKANIESKKKTLGAIRNRIWKLSENPLFKGFKEQKDILVEYKDLFAPKISLKNNDNEDVEFYLKGIIIKSGERGGGHYWGYLKASEKEGDWYIVNDERTIKISDEDVDDETNLAIIEQKIKKHNIYQLIFNKVKGIEVLYEPTGLANSANYCWFNTVNQMLFSDSDITNYEDIFHELNKDDDLFNNLIKELDLDKKLIETELNKLKYNLLNKIIPTLDDDQIKYFEKYIRENFQEYLLSILDYDEFIKFFKYLEIIYDFNTKNYIIDLRITELGENINGFNQSIREEEIMNISTFSATKEEYERIIKEYSDIITNFSDPELRLFKINLIKKINRVYDKISSTYYKLNKYF